MNISLSILLNLNFEQWLGSPDMIIDASHVGPHIPNIG